MGDVISIDKHRDFKHCTYVDYDGSVGVAMRENDLEFIPIGLGLVEIKANGISTVIERKALSEFIAVAKILFDPDDKSAPGGSMASLNYPE